ncbi:hypothetical protein DFH08DRAFT_1089185 [Mycena albidolilacea]|uniref:Uncharacterized protein n=1 Tax=Mycena albidolilacea TaxID=1033008 RepID=A0AAD6Z340_9AGAR|nr:hypothetical protein DFH08DRAFT_1089185 [Mycena albidolilacea]
MDNAHPSVPLELERIVFELAAELYPETMPSLLLVAARVLEWIEPLRYRTFTLTGTASVCPQLRFLKQAVKSKPPQFIHDNVWYLCAADDFFGDSLADILPVCTGLRSLVIFHVHPRMLTQLEATRPRRLSAPIQDFFLKDRVSFDLTFPVFSSLTHLDVFDGLDLDLWSNWSGLALLPLLTHLAFLALEDAVVANILAILCPKLLVLVSMYSDEKNHLRFLSDGVDRDDSDPRFVSMVLSSEAYALDWQIGIRGGMDFWARADAFVAKKRRGEIEPKSRHWIEDGDGI